MNILIRDKCTIVNISCLEIIANHYNIEEANPQIAAYKSEIDRVCEELKLKIYEDFMTDPSSLFKYVYIEFRLRWNPDRSVLTELLWKVAFCRGP